MDGYYYLHSNGNLIFKRAIDGGQVADFRESDFVRAFWPLDLTDRETAWQILIEGLAAGADPKRVHELAAKWMCDEEDAQVYADRVGVRLFPDGNAVGAVRLDFVNLQESPSGFGDNALEAMAELAKALGYRPQKMWGNTFAQLCRKSASTGVTTDG